jgi:ribonuclease VapC
MSNSVLDASAFLAYLRDEPGALVVETALANGAAMSAVNWAEVLSKISEVDTPQTLIQEMRNQGVLDQQLQIYEFSKEDALEVALLRPLTKSIGLSLGDRACLSLSKRLGVPALTADRIWAQVATGIIVQVIR